MSTISGKGLNGSYIGVKNLSTNAPVAVICATAVALLMQRDNTTDGTRRELKSQLDGIGLMILPQAAAVTAPVDKQKIVSAFENGFVHAYGGNEDRAKTAKMDEQPTLIAIRKAFGYDEQSKRAGKHDGLVGIDVVKTLDQEIGRHPI